MRESYAALMAKLAEPAPTPRQVAKPPPPRTPRPVAKPPPPPTPRQVAEPPPPPQPAQPQPSFRNATSTQNNEVEWIQLRDGSIRSVQKHRVIGPLTRPPPAMVEASAVRRSLNFREFMTPDQLAAIGNIPKDVLKHGGGFNGYGNGGAGYNAAIKAMATARMYPPTQDWGTSTVVSAPSACAPSAYIAASAAAAAPQPEPPQRTEYELPVVFDSQEMYRPYQPASGPILTGRDMEREAMRERKRKLDSDSLGPRHLLCGRIDCS